MRIEVIYCAMLSDVLLCTILSCDIMKCEVISRRMTAVSDFYCIICRGVVQCLMWCRVISCCNVCHTDESWWRFTVLRCEIVCCH